MEVEPTWKSPISRLAITGVEFFLPKEVRFSPSFHVVLLKVQEKKNQNKAVSRGRSGFMLYLHYTFVTKLQDNTKISPNLKDQPALHILEEWPID